MASLSVQIQGMSVNYVRKSLIMPPDVIAYIDRAPRMRRSSELAELLELGLSQGRQPMLADDRETTIIWCSLPRNLVQRVAAIAATCHWSEPVMYRELAVRGRRLAVKAERQRKARKIESLLPGPVRRHIAGHEDPAWELQRLVALGLDSSRRGLPGPAQDSVWRPAWLRMDNSIAARVLRRATAAGVDMAASIGRFAWHGLELERAAAKESSQPARPPSDRAPGAPGYALTDEQRATVLELLRQGCGASAVARTLAEMHDVVISRQGVHALGKRAGIL